MKVLIVSSAANGKLSPFVKEQVSSLEKKGITCSYFLVKKSGLKGYLSHYRPLKKAIRKEKPDLIHAHYGLCGLLANLQRKIPVITTYHGSDIHQKKNRRVSILSIKLSAQNIYVSNRLKELAKDPKGHVIACGIDASLFTPKKMEEAKETMLLDKQKTYALFSSSFDNPIKNSPLARKAIKIASKRLGKKIELIELKERTRPEVAQLLNASHFLILTSLNEGSPQVIKEALSCSRPIVSTNVGSISEMINDVEGCFLIENELESAVEGIMNAMQYTEQYTITNGRNQLIQLKLDLPLIADQIKSVYHLT